MASYETHKSHQEGQWSPPQQYVEPQGYREHQGYREPQEMSVAASSPRTATTEPYWNSPPIPSKDTPYDSPPPPVSPRFHEAPEVAEPFYYDHHQGRPLSPSSHGDTTLYSPRIPPFALHDKSESVAAAAPIPADKPRRCGIKRRWFNIGLIIIVIWILVLGLALGVGLGVGLKNKKSSNEASKIAPLCRDHPELCIGGALGGQYYSKRGAFNGSGIALAGESWNKQQRRIFTLYFQHWTGDIRFMQYTTDKKWIGGTKSETVATDAKNATAISTVAYSFNGTQYFHVFYISKQNLVRQVTQTNVSNIWQPGPLNKLNLTAFDTPGNVGLQACWKGNFYGDSDYKKMPTPSGETNGIPFDQRLGMNIWFATDDSTFQQYAWYNGFEDWGALDKWQGKNTRAGVGCYSWGEGTTTYTMMVNKANDTEFWWKDTANATSTEQHPIQSWNNATKGLIADVYPTTSLGYTTYFYAQMADKSIQGFNITYQAENTTIVTKDTFTITNPAGPIRGLGGTHLTASAFAYTEKEGDKPLWDSLYVFYQTDGDDITAFTRPIKGGEWSNGKLTIPTD